jgi:hypothetical protein
MYVPYQVLRGQVPGGLAPPEQRRADEQLGRLAAALSGSGLRVAARMPGLGGVLVLLCRRSASFRKAGELDAAPTPAGSPRAGIDATIAGVP